MEGPRVPRTLRTARIALEAILAGFRTVLLICLVFVFDDGARPGIFVGTEGASRTRARRPTLSLTK